MADEVADKVTDKPADKVTDKADLEALAERYLDLWQDQVAAMAADAVDIDSARTGEQRAGLYFSVWGLLKKGANALGGAIGLAAVAFFGFEALADPALAGTPDGNSESALMMLAVLYSIVPAGFKFIALPFIWNYPLTEKRQIRIRERLDRRGVAIQAQRTLADKGA